jgi:hypothetical protein
MSRFRKTSVNDRVWTHGLRIKRTNYTKLTDYWVHYLSWYFSTTVRRKKPTQLQPVLRCNVEFQIVTRQNATRQDVTRQNVTWPNFTWQNVTHQNVTQQNVTQQNVTWLMSPDKMSPNSAFWRSTFLKSDVTYKLPMYTAGTLSVQNIGLKKSFWKVFWSQNLTLFRLPARLLWPISIGDESWRNINQPLSATSVARWHNFIPKITIFGMENVGTFNGQLVYFTVIWYIWLTFGKCCGSLVYFLSFWYI